MNTKGVALNTQIPESQLDLFNAAPIAFYTGDLLFDQSLSKMDGWFDLWAFHVMARHCFEDSYPDQDFDCVHRNWLNKNHRKLYRFCEVKKKYYTVPEHQEGYAGFKEIFKVIKDSE